MSARWRVAARAGRFPRSAEALAALPGVGRSTAAAIAAFAFGRRAAILDGNVKRVLARCFGVAGFPGETAVARQLWMLAERLVPARGVRAYTQGLMDLGATVCRRVRPLCGACPVAHGRDARALGRAVGCEIASLRRLPPLEHGFTHFRLRVQPLVCQVRRCTPRAEQGGRLWLDLADAAGSAVPAP